jgi:hypothetical protein
MDEVGAELLPGGLLTERILLERLAFPALQLFHDPAQGPLLHLLASLQPRARPRGMHSDSPVPNGDTLQGPGPKVM